MSAIMPNSLHEMFHSDESLAGLSGTVSESPGMLSPLRQSETHSLHENGTILSADTGMHFQVIFRIKVNYLLIYVCSDVLQKVLKPTCWSLQDHPSPLSVFESSK